MKMSKKTVDPHTKYQHKPISPFLALFQTTWHLLNSSNLADTQFLVKTQPVLATI